jgi:Epoxide hydrolase N terminus
MQLRLKSSVVDQNRRRLLDAAALGILASGVTNLLPAGLAAASEARAVRPFKIKIPDARLADLRRRILATRWPDRETIADDIQGIQLATMQELAHRWGDGYSWRKIEASSMPYRNS